MTASDGKDVKLLGKSKDFVPSVGQGTWRMGGDVSPNRNEAHKVIEALRYGISLGLTLIDTAEFYGGGHTEELVGQAIKGYNREDLFIVSKVWQTNLHYDDVLKAAERSLQRLQTRYIDLYLIHWPNPAIPLSETMKAMEKLVELGKIRYIGVSNFDVNLMEEARSYLSREDIMANQVRYSLLDRTPEESILPYCEREKITLMAYTPLAKGNLAKDKKLAEIGKKYKKTAAQVALNWLISKTPVIAIPKAITKKHIEENAGSMGWRLSEEDIMSIDKYFKKIYV